MLSVDTETIPGGAAAFGLPPKLDRMIRIGLAKVRVSWGMRFTPNRVPAL